MSERRRHDERRALLFVALFATGGSSVACTEEPAFTEILQAIRLAPGSMAFGDVPSGALSARTILVLNDGNASYAPSAAPFIEGLDVSAFDVTSPCAAPVVAGGTCEIGVAFHPTEERAYTATLVIEGAKGERVAVPFTGTGTAAEVVLSPATVDFGSASVGTSTRQTVQVRNAGTESLSFDLVVDEAGFLMGGARTRTVALEPGASLDVGIDFVPSRGGAFAATLTAALCGEACGPSIALTGAAVAPRIDVQPRSVDLGQVSVATTGTGSFVIGNSGSGDLVVTAIDVVDAQAALTATLPELPLILAEGETRAIDVAITPATPDGGFAAELLVESNDPLSQLVLVPVRAVVPGKALRAIPTAAHFGRLDAGDDRALDVVARSVGTEPITITELVVEGRAFELDALVPALPLTLAPNDSVSLKLHARPDGVDVAAGGGQGALTFVVDGGTPAVVRGTFNAGTTGCQPRAPAPNLALGNVRVGQGITAPLIVRNVGTTPCVLRSARPADGFPYDSAFSTSTTQLASIAPGASGRLLFSYQPNDDTAQRAFVSLEFEDQPERLLVSATGRGVTGNLIALPPAVEIGPVLEGCTGQAVEASFFNEGGSSVEIIDVAIEPPDAPFTVDPRGAVGNVRPGELVQVAVRPDSGLAAGTYTALLRATSSNASDATATLTLTVQPSGSLLQETFEVPEAATAVDILFVVDNSGSMADDQAQLAANFELFIDAATSAGNQGDFHIGVTSTDVLTPGALNGGLIGSPAFLTERSSNLANQFAERALLGIDGAGLELGLEGMRRALDAPNVNGRNAGFLRSNAALSVVIITDEEDGGAFPELQQLDPTSFRAADSYIGFLQGLKGGSIANAPVLFSAVRAPGAASRYERVASAFNGILLDITSPDWGTELGALGAATFNLQRQFQLASAPVASSVRVRVDGVPVTRFTVRESEKMVELLDAPSPEAIVVIEYEAQCL